MKYRLAIFDFDGTLADSFPLFLKTANQLAAKYQFRRIEEEEVEVIRAYDARTILKHIGLPLWKAPVVARECRIQMTRDIAQIRLFEGVSDLLQQLSKMGILLAVVSSNSLENVRQVLGPENTAVVSDFECGVSLLGKRHRLRRVLRKMRVACHDAIYIGDEIRDLEAARSEGIAFGAVAWGYTNVESLKAHSPQEIFMTLGEMVKKIT